MTADYLFAQTTILLKFLAFHATEIRN